MEKFEDILNENYKGLFYAHKLSGDTTDDEKEKLEDHSQKTLDYYEKIISELNLENIIKKMLGKAVKSENVGLFYDLFKALVYYHDIGKVSPVFQKEKMGNNKFAEESKIYNIGSNHSLYGKFLFDFLFVGEYAKNLEGESEKERSKKLQLILLFSDIISRHHTSLREINNIKEELKEQALINKLNDLILIKSKFFKNKPYFFNHENSSALWNYYDFSGLMNLFNKEEKESLFYLYKLIYSLLIISDYYATIEFMNGKNFVPDLKKIDDELKKKILMEFYKPKEINGKKYSFNKKLENKEYSTSLIEEDVNNITELNDLKTKILLEADKSLREKLSSKPDKKVFYLNVPTGGGKTNTSMKLACSILEKRSELNKIFYIFPFINIIEQNYKVIKDTLNLNENEISPVYSTSIWNLESKEEKDGLKYVLDNEFLNFPFVVMSNVNFFNAFIKAGKNSNYKLSNLANSIVILDEIQSLNDEDWTLFNDFIEFASKNLNIYFIIMSATLPRLDKISLEISKENNENFGYAVDLLDKPERFFNHPSFKKRVVLEYSNKINSYNDIVGDVEINMQGKSKILVVFNTIKASTDFYDKLIKNKKQKEIYKEFEIFLLNSTLLPSRRKEIIEKLENTKDSDEKIILVSTQSIEAGVDVDCDYGLREMAIFDSIEQVAGRVNRENNGEGHLKIFKLKDKDIRNSVYRGSFRAKIMESYHKEKDINDFLKNRDFSLSDNGYYEQVIHLIRKANESKIMESPADKVTLIRNLDYDSLNKEDVINQNTVSIFVGLKVSKKYFTDSEIDFLENLGVNISNNYIEGERVWDLYKEFINNIGKISFAEKKIESKKIASILSKFIFAVSIFRSDTIKDFLREPIGELFYLDPELEIYDYNKGLKNIELLNNII